MGLDVSSYLITNAPRTRRVLADAFGDAQGFLLAQAQERGISLEDPHSASLLLWALHHHGNVLQEDTVKGNHPDTGKIETRQKSVPNDVLKRIFESYRDPAAPAALKTYRQRGQRDLIALDYATNKTKPASLRA